LPLDKDNDLVTVTGSKGIAQGQIAHVSGRVLDRQGQPLSRMRVEIWQCDSNGRYHHPGDRCGVSSDPNFQGYGQFVTGADGGYRFRTIKPVPYPGRAPHIHFAISGPGVEPITTQMYIAGAPENRRDFLLNSIADPNARKQLIVPLEADGPNGELSGVFDIVLAADQRFSRIDATMLPSYRFGLV
jgi:protocatechuate 3,4-dioxygenase beta subunit